MDFSCAWEVLLSWKASRPSSVPRKWNKKKIPESFELENNSGVFNTVGGGEPVLCLQKGILSPSCLSAFGKVDFRSLYRLIYHCERDFSFASERDSHFFDKMIVSHFSPHVNHVKLFHLVVLDPRSVRDPGLPPGAFALPRCAPQGGWWWGVGWWFGWCTDGLAWTMQYFWFLKSTFEVIEVVLMGRWTWLFLVCDVRCRLFAQSLLCLRSPLLFFCWNFTGCDFERWSEKRAHLFDIKQSSYYKTAWMRFCNHTHTVWGLKRLFQYTLLKLFQLTAQII